MPNGGSDCCGTCWFNARNKGEAGYGHALATEPARCTIRIWRSQPRSIPTALIIHTGARSEIQFRSALYSLVIRMEYVRFGSCRRTRRKFGNTFWLCLKVFRRSLAPNTQWGSTPMRRLFGSSESFERSQLLPGCSASLPLIHVRRKMGLSGGPARIWSESHARRLLKSASN